MPNDLIFPCEFVLPAVQTIIMSSQKETAEVLRSSVVEQVKGRIEDWLPSLSVREATDIRALACALGNLKLKQLNSSVPLAADSLRSSYEEAYGSTNQKQSFETAILRYRKLHELPCSGVLTTDAVQRLQVWVDRADPSRTASVLNGLRTLYSLLTVRIRPPVTNNRLTFRGFSPEDFRRSTTKEDFFPVRRRVLSISKRESESSSPVKTHPNPGSPDRKKPRGAHMFSDRRLLAHGEGDSEPSSCYQKAYVTHYFKYKPGKALDYRTSATHAVIPDLAKTTPYAS